MRAKLRKLVWKQVKKGIAERFPNFTLSVDVSDGLLWRLEGSNALFFYITIDNLPRDDNFAFEVHWNIIDELPLHRRGSPKPEHFFENRGTYRIQLFYWKKNMLGHFDLDPEYSRKLQEFDYKEASKIFAETRVYPSVINTDVDILIERAPAIIEDALDMLTEHGIPFFRQVAQAHGVANLNL